ncbi:MAG: hypothetical protein IK077_01465, partial [Thermoguttaceae bacterium]|nr:hypothetical protein [Thermoguttaceae bacterium]
MLFDKTRARKNSLQVVNQYEAPDGKNANCYDVMILINGLPLGTLSLRLRVA